MKKLGAYRRPHRGTQPDYDYPPYASTAKRHPTQPLVIAPQTLSELTGPLFGPDDVRPRDHEDVHQSKRDRTRDGHIPDERHQTQTPPEAPQGRAEHGVRVARRHLNNPDR